MGKCVCLYVFYYDMSMQRFNKSNILMQIVFLHTYIFLRSFIDKQQHTFSTFSWNKRFFSVVIDCGLIYGKLISMLRPYNRTIAHKSISRVLVVLSFQSSSVKDDCVPQSPAHLMGLRLSMSFYSRKGKMQKYTE